MAGSINKVTLIGHLGADPEVRQFQNGSEVCNISLATSEGWKDKNTGEKKEKTEWHRVVIYGKLVAIAQQYLGKGARVYIEGKLQTRKWQDAQGADKYTTEVVVQDFGGQLVFLDRKEADRSRNNTADNSAPASKGFDLDDEIPF